MNGNLVQGANCTVFKYDTDLSVWVPYACARSASLSLSTDTIETSITGSGNFRTYLPVADAFTGSLEGVTQLEMVNKISIADLMASQIAHEIFLMRFEDINNDGDVFTKEGYFFITNTTQTASFDNVATFSVNLQGTGPLTLIFTPTPLIFGVMHRAEFVLLAGNVSVTVPDVYGVALDNIINISIDGYDFPIIIGSGTPVGQEVKYQPGGAIITVPFANDDTDLNGFIEYQIIYEAS
jgi:predicted secreted protein